MTVSIKRSALCLENSTIIHTKFFFKVTSIMFTYILFHEQCRLSGFTLFSDSNI